jgi:peptidoglycan/xylan/chitin deacetylase (PgdA/CDA1 family)
MSESTPRTRAQRRRSRQIRLSITASVFLAVVVVLGISLTNGKASSASDSAGVVRDREVATATPEQDKTPGKDRPRTTSTPKATSTPDAEVATDPQVGIAPEPTSATSVNAEGGLVPVISQVKTTDRVVFLTIDDGYEKDPEFKDYVVANKIPLTMFLVSQAAAAKPEFFSSIATVKGSSIQNHGVNHSSLRTLSAAGQRKQICGNVATEKKLFGTAPTLVRPPYGAYNQTTRSVAYQCGMKALVLWSASMPSSKLYYGSGTKLKPGDIILIHFRPTDGVKNIKKLLGIINAANLQIGSLTDYVK